ncbi:hypothetical protein HK097_010695 [Rhizophlyctis rosea]|uniref:TmcB/TmcC TPR repeats domain-containing protein n=1 Tax=Rhizophlyctis rosea TaxID=64517 RepID=A0AAD5X2Y8_9FUNG|nr:hypothetical protein HK097_010695 [Rhizophlyctis rosea]
MPLVELYVAAFMCRGFNDTHVLYLLSDPSECISTLYLMIPAAVGLLYLAIQGPIITLVYFTINPSGHEADSKTTGRVDSIYTICRLALAITHELRVDDPTAVTVVLIMTSLIVTYLAIRYQPFFAGQMNDIRAGIFVAALTSAIQSAACKKAGGYDSVTGFVVLCASLLPAFFAGYFIAKGYRKWVVDGVYRRLKDPKAAVTKTAALKTSAANVLGWKPTLKSAQFDDHTLHSGERNGSDDRVSRASNDEENPATAQDEGLDDAEVLADVDKIVNERPEEPVKIFLDEWHVELSCRYLQQNDSPRALHLANKLFEEGVKQYPKSAHLILMKAYYIRDFGFQRLTNVEHDLRHVKSLKPAFDTRFFMFFEERTLEQELRQEDLLASHLNVTGFAEVLAMETSARKWHLATLLAWKAFWDYLKSDAASAECMPYLIEMAATNQEMAEKYYSRMVAKYPNSKQALRRYGAFLMTARVVNDTEHAQRLLDRAEDIENEESRAQMMQSENMRSRRPSIFSTLVNNDTKERNMRGARSGDELRTAGSRVVPLQDSDEEGERRGTFSGSTGRRGTLDATIEAASMEALEAGDDRELQSPRTRRPSVAFGETTDHAGQDHKISPRNRMGNVSLDGGMDEETGTLSRDEMNDEQDVVDARERACNAERFRKHEMPIEKAKDLRVDVRREPILSGPDTVPSWAKKAGPGSLPSVPSATSSQREGRQVRYLKSIFEGRLKSNISNFRHWIIGSCVILLGLLIGGCVISLLTYKNITSALSVAYQRMRPRFQTLRMMMYIRRMQSLALGQYSVPDKTATMQLLLSRFANTLYNIWNRTLIPILMQFHLNDPDTILIKRSAEGQAFFDQVNPYFLATMIYDSGDWIMNRTADWILANPVQFARDPHPRMFMENWLTINSAYQETSHVGQNAFVVDMSQGMLIMEILLVVIPVATLLIAIAVFRPSVGKATAREVQMLSLALRLPKKFIVERIESLEIEIENIMEEIEDENAPEDAPKLSIGKDVPPASVMENHGKRKMTTMYSVVLVLFALLGAIMFVPALIQSKMGIDYSFLIEEISTRAYRATGVASLSWEVAASDSTCWLPGDNKLWLKYFTSEFKKAQENMMVDTDGIPSILRIPATATYVNTSEQR